MNLYFATASERAVVASDIHNCEIKVGTQETRI